MNLIMYKTKLFKLSFAVALFAISFNGTAQINTPAPSPAGSVSATVGLTEIEINYSRPQMKGRKIFGDSDALVPNGQLWRAGANAGTTVKFSDDVKIAGQDLAAGEYLFLATPGASEWEVVFYSDISLGGNVSAYDDSKAALKAKVKSSKLTETVGTLTYNISEISENSENANIQLAWENTAVNVPVQVSFDETVMKAIAENTVVNPRNLMTAARYYLSADKDLNQALAWVNTYLATGDNSTQFWNVHVKAQILAKQGNKKEAIKVAKESMAAAKAFEGGDFGYIKRNEDLIASLK
ncbi:Protein of unknown function [Reichenbachiella faecimaris]|uniref:DUF2911 domain-containing protein n=2 Tax=Reichenbachiella faecimaris TaxID=692418 RepID=A0A1W2G5V3_REIFA|nr:Protein of unknown function [Reichenbachiella faecimaris]